MRGIEFQSNFHVIFKLRYNQIYQLKTTFMIAFLCTYNLQSQRVGNHIVRCASISLLNENLFAQLTGFFP